MNNLPSKTAARLIESLESGEIDQTEAARRVAQIHVAKSDNYTGTIVTGLLIAALLWTVTSSGIITLVAIYLTWDSFQEQRTDRKMAFKHISQGQILEYLPDADRELFPELEQAAAPSLIHTPTLNDSKITITQDDIALTIAKTLKPLIISARPRVGKGMVISQALTQAKRIHNASIWAIQPKPSASELGYWKQCDRFLGLNLEDYPTDDPSCVEALTLFVYAWRAQPHRPTILFIDELVKLQALQPKWVKHFLTPQLLVEGSSGETDNRFLWLVTQSPLVTDLGLTGGNRSVFDFLTLQTPQSKEHLASVRKSFDSLKSLPTDEDYTQSPKSILCWHSSHAWSAVPEYEVPTVAPGERVCPDLAPWVRSPIPDTPDALVREWGGGNVHEIMARGLVESLIPGIQNPAIELIEEIENPDRQEALKIAYQWAIERQDNDQEVNKESFLNRARNERQSEYLKINRSQVWDELQALL